MEISITSPKSYYGVVDEHNFEKVIAQVEDSIANEAELQRYPWLEVIIVGDYSVNVRDIVARKYIEAGWNKVYHQTSAENNDRAGLSSFVFLTAETAPMWEKVYRDNIDNHHCIQ